MPGENIMDWSLTAANNGTADSSINWAEGQARASVNDSARSMMAALAKHRNLTNGSITTAGTNTVTFTSGLSYTAVPTGLQVRLCMGGTNTGAATLNMDGIGAVAIARSDGSALQGGELILGEYREFRYDSVKWLLLIPTPATQADQEVGTLTAPYVSPAKQQYHPSAAKAWCIASVTGVVTAGYNVASVTDNGPGNISVTLTVAMSTANYSAIAGIFHNPGGTGATTRSATMWSIVAGGAAFVSVNHGDFGQTDPTQWHFAFYGDQA